MLVYAPSENHKGGTWTTPYSAMGDEELEARAAGMSAKKAEVSFVQIKAEVEM